MRNDPQHHKSVFDGLLSSMYFESTKSFQKSAKHNSHDVRVSDEDDNEDSDSDDHTQAGSRKRAKKPLESKQKVDMPLKHCAFEHICWRPIYNFRPTCTVARSI